MIAVAAVNPNLNLAKRFPRASLRLLALFRVPRLAPRRLLGAGSEDVVLRLASAVEALELLGAERGRVGDDRRLFPRVALERAALRERRRVRARAQNLVHLLNLVAHLRRAAHVFLRGL